MREDAGGNDDKKERVGNLDCRISERFEEDRRCSANSEERARAVTDAVILPTTQKGIDSSITNPLYFHSRRHGKISTDSR